MLMTFLRSVLGGLAWALACGAIAGGVAAGNATPGGPAWNSLTPAQQQVLAPLARDWQQLDGNRKQKWLEIATRYPSMPAEQQTRMQERMSEWARMTPEQRGQARVNFQQARSLPSEARREQWEAYQALPKERREELARQASRRASAPHAGVNGTAPTPSLRGAPLTAQAPKSNVVTPTRPSPPRVVSPALVQTGPGATTSLVATPPRPRQPKGQAKIEASPNVVDRSTLLPKRGPQAAVPAPPKPSASSASAAGH